MPEDVARVVAFLAGEDGGWVNGEFWIPGFGLVTNGVNRSDHYHLGWFGAVRRFGEVEK